MGLREVDPLAQLSLPPGFRFCPTDEELLVQYLSRKVAGQQFSLQIIGDIDLYKFDPWVLPGKAIFGEKEWYFFSPRERKYPNGSRPNRTAGSGYWKATGTDKTITTEGHNVGIKKSLVFYIGKAPKGTKTNWIMHEYRLLDSSRSVSNKLDDWVLCRIYNKNFGDQKFSSRLTSKEYSTNGSSSSSLSQTHLDDAMNSLPKIEDRLFSLPRVKSMETLHQGDKNNLNNFDSESFDWTSIAKLSSMYEVIPDAYSDAQNTKGCVTFANNAINPYMYLAAPASQAETLVKRVSPVKVEVQSGLQSHQVDDNSSFFEKNKKLNPYGLI